MDIKTKLNKFGLDTKNTIVIGSGILNALNLRENKDIDIIVTKKKYKELSNNKHFKKIQSHGREILADNLFEIGIDWIIAKKKWEFKNLLSHSIIINGVCYITIEFLLNAKRCWLANGDIRQKDIDDVKMIEQYLSNLKIK